jgi:hypothetical protein
MESIMFFWALSYLPLADTGDVLSGGADLRDGDLGAVPARSASAGGAGAQSVVGFIGVIIALRPSTATLTWPALIAIVGSLGFAVFLIITRMLRGTSDVVMVSGSSAPCWWSAARSRRSAGSGRARSISA